MVRWFESDCGIRKGSAEAEVWCGEGDDEDGLWGWVIINYESLRWCVSE